MVQISLFDIVSGRVSGIVVQISLFDLVLGPGVICCGTDQFV